MPLLKTNTKIFQPLAYKTYLTIINDSVGTKMFRHFYAKLKGRELDIMRNGELSCAFYVSSILTIFKLIKEPHGTVSSTVKDLIESGWQKVKRPRAGSVLVWAKIDFGPGDAHKHIGFYIGGSKAISNSYKTGTPVIHHWTFGVRDKKPRRRIEAIFWNKGLK